jgi:GT2 family glycosyltransferase
MFKANIASEIGLLDDFFFVYFEDVDYSLRIKKAGFELGLQEKSVIYHHEGASFKGKIKKIEGTVSPYTHYLRLRNHLYFNSKYNAEFNFFGKWIYQIFQIFSYILYFTIRLRFNKLKMSVKGFIDGLKSI